ncbi:MAG: ATP-binding protein [Kiritimatiellae bacterium]|nr:ATP-binding protein [Kiritimatiellia bacterium]MBQ6330506.1 ATP-binding protein [Kiritimatiellia bacterium]
MTNYKNRICDALLRQKLQGVGAVLLEGPKWCGKTTTCERLAKSVLYMGDPVAKEKNLLIASVNINELLDGDEPRLIDEWQLAPKFWDAVRFRVDHSEGFGHFILTGSVVPPDTNEISHTGTGRIVRLRMRPMSLWESQESSGSVSLGALMNGEMVGIARCQSRSLSEMAYLVCRGGWPVAVGQQGDMALERAQEYYEATVESDMSKVDNVPRDPERVRRLMRSYARLQSTQAKLTAIKQDMIEHDVHGLDEDTVKSYIGALKKLFVIEDSPAWCPCLRSKAVIRTSDTRYFADPSVIAAALGIGPGDMMRDPRSFGNFFETLAMRDLRCYADAIGGSVSHYLDANGLECDAIVHLRDGRFGLVEIKLGGKALIDEGVSTLNALADIVDVDKMKKPAFKMILTAVGDFAYARPEDGIVVCPISALKP